MISRSIHTSPYKIALVVLLFSSGTFCVAQTQSLPDYLVTNKGDTIKGKLQILSFQHDQVKIEGTKKALPAVQVVSLRMNGQLYATQLREGAYRIMKLIKPGYLSLYAFRLENQATYEGRFLSRRDGKTSDVPNLYFKKYMTAFLGDCREVTSEIEAGTLTRREIEQIVDKYNACLDRKTMLRETPVVTTAPVIESPKLTIVQNFKKRIESLPLFDDKQNALDLMKDIEEKVGKGQKVPPYLIEALKSYMTNVNDMQQEVEKFGQEISKP